MYHREIRSFLASSILPDSSMSFDTCIRLVATFSQNKYNEDGSLGSYRLHWQTRNIGTLVEGKPGFSSMKLFLDDIAGNAKGGGPEGLHCSG
jgi:hypothetical protein